MSGSRQAGVDAACASGPEDDAPIEQATVEERVLLTEDRGPPRRLTPLTDSAQGPDGAWGTGISSESVNAATERS